MPGRLPRRRRTYLVKQGFQLRWAAYPIAILTLFLLAAGVYLHREVLDILRLELYRPHSRIENTWQVVGPAVTRVVVGGGAGALGLLLLWGAGWFRRLRRDLDALTLWTDEVADGPAPPGPARASEPEVAALARSLDRGRAVVEAWERDVEAAWQRVARAVPDPARADEAALRRAAPGIQEAVAELRRAVGRLRVDEGLG